VSPLVDVANELLRRLFGEIRRRLMLR